MWTVLRIIKLDWFPVPVRFQSGIGTLNFCCYFTMLCDIQELCTYYFGAWWDAEYLGVLPGSKLCTTFLKIAKHFKTVAVRLRLIFQLTYDQYCTSIFHVLRYLRTLHIVRSLMRRLVKGSLWSIYIPLFTTPIVPIVIGGVKSRF